MPSGLPDLHVLSLWGLPGLFVLTVLSGAAVPLPSDALLLALVALGQPAGRVIGVAAAGSTAGAWLLYGLGTQVEAGGGGRPGRWIRERLGRNPERAARARERLI